MSVQNPFKKLTLPELAAAIDLHPHEVVRVLVFHGELPDDLRFDQSAPERVRELGGVETWWTAEPPAEDEALAAAIGAKVIASKALDGDTAARFDNLLRGLDDGKQRGMRRAAQKLIKAGHLKTCSSPTGMRIHATESGAKHFKN